MAIVSPRRRRCSMNLTIDGYSSLREEYLPVTVNANLDRFGYLDGWRLVAVEGTPVHTDHASIWADELGITDDAVEAAARQEAGLNEAGW